MGFFDASLLITALNLRARRKRNLQAGPTRMYRIIKRILETILSLILLLLLAPAFLLISLAIRWDTPGPALFRQTRIGKDGKPFTFYKFRSMYCNIDRNAHHAFLAAFVNGELDGHSIRRDVFKPLQANQVTRVGRFLRKKSLDELPQLINVVKGDMSFIGPRPNIPAEVDAYKDWHRKRLAVLPGITGLAQINGRSSILFDQIARYDIYYVDNESLGLDLRIVLETMPAVLRGDHAK
jgi:lipopolysaccharide/colanic/teichoic acid biosynthesis glycosyltransferase